MKLFVFIFAVAATAFVVWLCLQFVSWQVWKPEGYTSKFIIKLNFQQWKDIYLLTVFQFTWAAVYAWVGGLLFQSFPMSYSRAASAILAHTNIPPCHFGGSSDQIALSESLSALYPSTRLLSQ